jgi:transcriptional regulator with XRE-family HTH domain
MTPSEIKSYRQRFGFKTSEFARAFGVTRQTVWTWETGERPVPLPVALLCELAFEIRDVHMAISKIARLPEGQN